MRSIVYLNVLNIVTKSILLYIFKITFKQKNKKAGKLVLYIRCRGGHCFNRCVKFKFNDIVYYCVFCKKRTILSKKVLTKYYILKYIS